MRFSQDSLLGKRAARMSGKADRSRRRPFIIVMRDWTRGLEGLAAKLITKGRSSGWERTRERETLALVVVRCGRNDCSARTEQREGIKEVETRERRGWSRGRTLTPKDWSLSREAPLLWMEGTLGRKGKDAYPHGDIPGWRQWRHLSGTDCNCCAL